MNYYDLNINRWRETLRKKALMVVHPLSIEALFFEIFVIKIGLTYKGLRNE